MTGAYLGDGQGLGTISNDDVCTPTGPPVFNNCTNSSTTYLGCNPGTIPGADPSVTASDNCGAVTVLSSITNETNARVITYTASNSIGVAVCTQIYTWSTAAPTIDTPPTAQTACVGASASFAVVSNTPLPGYDHGLTYQWRKGGMNLTDGGNISGATTATLTINPVAAGDAGSYDVVVSNACGSTPSDAVALNLCPQSFVFVANHLIKINQNKTSEGDIQSNYGDIIFGRGAPGTHTGSLFAGDDIVIDRQNTIAGNATAEGEIRRSSSATITGSTNPHTNIDVEGLPNPSFSAGGPNKTVRKNGTPHPIAGFLWHRQSRIQRHAQLERRRLLHENSRH